MRNQKAAACIPYVLQILGTGTDPGYYGEPAA